MVSFLAAQECKVSGACFFHGARQAPREKPNKEAGAGISQESCGHMNLDDMQPAVTCGPAGKHAMTGVLVAWSGLGVFRFDLAALAVSRKDLLVLFLTICSVGADRQLEERGRGMHPILKNVLTFSKAQVSS